MFYLIAFVLSLCSLLISFLLTVRAGRRYRSTRLLSPSRVLAIGVFFAIWLLFLPYSYFGLLSNTPLFPRLWQSVWIGVYQSIRFFVVAADFSDLQAMSAASGIEGYTVLGTILLILSPALTFSFLLSFFHNFSAYRKYLLHPNAPTYVFSELNEKSYHLAADIKRNHRDAVILFADVFEENNEENFELVEHAKEIDAICFNKDMLSLNLRFHSKRSLLCFFAIAEENSVRGVYRHLTSSTTAEEENLRQASHIAHHPFYSTRPNTNLFVFTSSAQGEILLDNLPKSSLTVRRVEHSRTLIMRTLFEEGENFLFQNAVLRPDGIREIRVLILGAGSYGTEMIKALTWCCQIDGYSLSIDVVDYDPLAEEAFEFACPELTVNNTTGDPDLPIYKINFHNNISTETGAFVKLLRQLQRPTYVFVALGNDESNIAAALTTLRVHRQTASENDADPFIHAIVYESESKRVLENAINERGQRYDIHCIGDLASSYSESVIINEEMTTEALEQHHRHYPMDADFKYDFRMRSCMALILYDHFAEICGQKTMGDPHFSELPIDEKWQIACADHRRWCAFMFSEGYVRSQSRLLSGHDPLSKTHSMLVPFSMLPEGYWNR